MEISIVPPARAELIPIAYHRYLQSIPSEDLEIEPSEANARFIADSLLIPAWERGEPILFALVGATIIGATFTTLPAPELELRRKSAHGHGTWVREDFRGRGVAGLLFEEVKRRLRAAGVEVTRGQVHLSNGVSRKTFAKLGFREYAKILSYEL